MTTSIPVTTLSNLRDNLVPPSLQDYFIYNKALNTIEIQPSLLGSFWELKLFNRS